MADIEFRERSYEGPLLHELQLGNAPRPVANYFSNNVSVLINNTPTIPRYPLGRVADELRRVG